MRVLADSPQRLVDIIPDRTSQGAIVHAVFPSRRGLPPSERTLIDFLADHIQK